MSTRAQIKCHRVLIIGDPGVGKTAIMVQFTTKGFNETYDPTLEDNHRKQVNVSNRVALVDVYEVYGPIDTYRALREQQMREANAALLVYSFTSLQSFKGIPTLRDELHAALASPRGKHREGKSGAQEGKGGRSIPICLVGNKSDRGVDREVSVKAGMELSKELGCGFVETSANNGTNVEEAFLKVIRILENVETEEPDEQEKPVVAAGGFRGRLGHIARSIRFKRD